MKAKRVYRKFKAAKVTAPESRTVLACSPQSTTKEYLRVTGFCVPGRAVGKERPRVNLTYTGRAHTITPKRTKAYELKVGLCARAAMVRPTKRRVCISVVVWFDVEGHAPPDADNVLKSVLDALNHIAYDDDDQVDMARVRRMYFSGFTGKVLQTNGQSDAPNAGEHAHIIIEELEDLR